MGDGFDLRAAAQTAIEFRDARDWAQFHSPRNLMAALAVEASELLETLLWRDPSSADVVADEALLADVRDELADVLILGLTLAHDLHLDLAEAIVQKLEANGRRYSVEEFRGRSDKAPH